MLYETISMAGSLVHIRPAECHLRGRPAQGVARVVHRHDLFAPFLSGKGPEVHDLGAVDVDNLYRLPHFHHCCLALAPWNNDRLRGGCGPHRRRS